MPPRAFAPARAHEPPCETFTTFKFLLLVWFCHSQIFQSGTTNNNTKLAFWKQLCQIWTNIIFMLHISWFFYKTRKCMRSCFIKSSYHSTVNDEWQCVMTISLFLGPVIECCFSFYSQQNKKRLATKIFPSFVNSMQDFFRQVWSFISGLSRPNLLSNFCMTTLLHGQL